MTIIETDTASLAVLLRDGSRSEHTDAEGSTFMTELLAGRLNEKGYADYLARLRTIYAALESVGRRLADDPIVSGFVDPALERADAIAADTAFWGPGDDTSPAADAYVERIEQSASWGGLFLAHHYTRYLGDLSGGRAIGRILRQEFALEGDGAAFYDFPAIPKPKPYKDAYRARLDALPFTPEQKLDVLAEVKVVFALNGALFTELSANLADYRR